MDVKRVAKFLAALAGAAAQLVAAGVVDGDTQRWLSQLVGILTAAAVFLVPNSTGVLDGGQTPGAGGDAAHGGPDLPVVGP